MYLHHKLTDSELIRSTDRVESQPLRMLADRLDLRFKALAAIVAAWQKIDIESNQSLDDFSDLINSVDTDLLS